jgi:CRISPR-associated Csx11 family protein
MASGIDKNHPKPTTMYLSQDITHMRRTTAFGYPLRNLLEHPPAILQNGGWGTLLRQIGDLLTELRELAIQTPAAPCTRWHVWRSMAIGPDGWLRKAFSETLAETRVPNNDVTLWDQSYVAAALFKSAVAEAIMEGPSFKCRNNLKQNTRWRVLTVGLGAGHYEARAVRIGDWTGARSEIDCFFDAVCRLIEVELAVGSLLYRDDEVLAFSFPGSPVDKGDSEQARSRIRNALEARIKHLGSHLDIPPVVRLSDSTRSMIRMAREVEGTRMRLRMPLHHSWTIPQNEKVKNGHTCPVCQLRPNGILSSKREKKGKLCERCAARRGGRLQEWLTGNVGRDSIWISEVADRNDRVALLTLGLDIGGWVDGTAVDSLRAQSVQEWSKNNSTAKKPLPDNHEATAEWIRTAMGRDNRAGQARSKLCKKLAPGLQGDARQWIPWQDFWAQMVQDRADAPSWDDLDGHDSRRAEWLVHQLFRKNASPGRVRRFWETTEVFFKDLLAKFREIVSADPNPWRVQRFVLTAMAGKWKDKETYQGHWEVGDDAAPLELLYRKDSNDFVTICNLARILGPTDDPGVLRGKQVEVVDDEGTRHSLVVQQVSEAPAPLGTYHPLIVLDRSPRRFRLLVPLEAADACVQTAAKKWETEFARVWDRLPLRAGIVAFPRKLPYQAVVEAARNVENDLDHCKPETWRVREVRTLGGVTALSVVRPDGELQLILVPVTLPDGRPDVFYPYCAVGEVPLRKPHDFAAPLNDPVHRRARQVYRWMPELRPGDGICVAPARVARVFLDSTARRFEPVPVRNLDDWLAGREIWRLVREVAPSLTAARTLEAVLLDKQETWAFPDSGVSQDAWLDFVRASLVNLWSVRGTALDTLVDAARRGILQETLAWHLHVLRQDMEEK